MSLTVQNPLFPSIKQKFQLARWRQLSQLAVEVSVSAWSPKYNSMIPTDLQMICQPECYKWFS